MPASIWALIAENALHNRIAFGSGLANQAIKMDRVECGCDVIAEISIRRLIFEKMVFEGGPKCQRKWHAECRVEQWKKANRIPR